MVLLTEPDTQPHLLLVGPDQAWLPVVRKAASAIGAAVDVQPDLPSAIAGMLRPERIYSHVLVTRPLQSREMDALVGMLDEVTRQPTHLLLLSCGSAGGAHAAAHAAIRLDQPNVAALIAALRGVKRPAPAGLPPLTPGELAASLHGGGLRMRFQPIVAAADLRPIGLEALARLHDPVRGVLHPKDFVPATIAAGRERALAGIVAARTFLDIADRLAGADLFVSLNLPMATILHECAVARGVEFCAVSGIAPAKILLEVLETQTPPEMVRLSRALKMWRQAGFRIAIDDAGPALPHWRAMLDLPFDVVKLDGALVADPDGQGLLETIVREARARGRFVVAEGIEDEAGLARMRSQGVDALQGFFFARPLPALAVPTWLEQWHGAATIKAA